MKLLSGTFATVLIVLLSIFVIGCSESDDIQDDNQIIIIIKIMLI